MEKASAIVSRWATGTGKSCRSGAIELPSCRRWILIWLTLWSTLTKNYGKSPCYQWVNPLFRLGHVQVRKLLVYHSLPGLEHVSHTKLKNWEHRCWFWVLTHHSLWDQHDIAPPPVSTHHLFESGAQWQEPQSFTNGTPSGDWLLRYSTYCRACSEPDEGGIQYIYIL